MPLVLNLPVSVELKPANDVTYETTLLGSGLHSLTYVDFFQYYRAKTKMDYLLSSRAVRYGVQYCMECALHVDHDQLALIRPRSAHPAPTIRPPIPKFWSQKDISKYQGLIANFKYWVGRPWLLRQVCCTD